MSASGIQGSAVTVQSARIAVRSIAPNHRKQINQVAIRDAIGPAEGDYLELANQWAKVALTHAEGSWTVTGDIADLRRKDRTFSSLSEAMAYALYSLGEFQKGAVR